VVLLFEGNVYPRKIISCNEENVYISVMVKSLKSWKCRETPDIFLNVNEMTRYEALILRISCQSEYLIPPRSYQHFLRSVSQGLIMFFFIIYVLVIILSL
jgi:hypothetical protein